MPVSPHPVGFLPVLYCAKPTIQEQILSKQMRITITNVCSSQPILMGNMQAPGYRIRFESDMLAGQAMFVPADTSADQLPGRQYFVETGCKGIENYRLWTSHDRPLPMIRELPQRGDYALVATVKAIALLNDPTNRFIIDVVVDDIAFGFTAREIGDAMPRVGDIISCTVRALSLWDEAL
jgi:hypothetical protein